MLKKNRKAKSLNFVKELEKETKALKETLVAAMPQYNESLKAKN